MQIALVGIGTILAVLFMIQMRRGKKYDYIVENLDSNEYPLNALYCVGFAWSATKIFKLQGKKASDLKIQASLLYNSQYAEYYANVAWAQMITLVHLFSTVAFLIAGIVYEVAVIMLVVGIYMCVLISMYSLQNMKNMLSSRTQECEMQLPEVVSTMAVLVNSGMVLREAWSKVAENRTGAIYDLMNKALENMKNGHSDADAIFLFGQSSNSTEIKKFTSALLQSMEKSGAELSDFLARQSSELWNQKRQSMLRKGEKAATKLLFPTVLVFIGIIIIVITAAFAGSLF